MQKIAPRIPQPDGIAICQRDGRSAEGDEQSELTFHTRRPHHKSRLGCVVCKKRRVKVRQAEARCVELIMADLVPSATKRNPPAGDANTGAQLAFMNNHSKFQGPGRVLALENNRVTVVLAPVARRGSWSPRQLRSKKPRLKLSFNLTRLVEGSLVEAVLVLLSLLSLLKAFVILISLHHILWAHR
jgi:hypothetical protein